MGADAYQKKDTRRNHISSTVATSMPAIQFAHVRPVALQHRRLYPDAQEASLRIASAALDFVLEFGGAAYLASREISDEIKAGELYVVKGAKSIQRTVYAVYPVRTAREELITEVISEFKYRFSLPKRPNRRRNKT